MNASPTLVGSAEPNSTVTLYDTDGISVLGSAAANAKGAWEITPGNALAEGAHRLTVTATDAAGDASPRSAGLALVIDTLPPLAPSITSVAGDTVDMNELAPIVDVTGMAEPDSIVTLSLDGAMDGVGADFGHTTASDDGSFTLTSLLIPAGQHKLQVTATDVAGNVSQPSLPVYETIADLAKVQPIGSNLGNLQDGCIDGATVFADADGNGVLDAGEASAVTDAAGAFALSGGSGELVATGGTDVTTGLSLPGALTAPAGSAVIDPLTTLLDACIAQTGASLAAANAAVAAALGLPAATDFTSLDPSASALSGSPAAEIADAKLADVAVDFTAALSRELTNTALPEVIFADVFAALAAQIKSLASGATLDLDDPATLLATIAGTTALTGAGTVAEVSKAAEQIVAAGNMQLDADAADEKGQAPLTGVAGVETVEQGAAANALGQIGLDPTLAATLVPQYTGAPLVAHASVSAALVTDAPRLAPGSDEGLSDTDNFTDDLSPTFAGTALPGTYVALLELLPSGILTVPPSQGSVVGKAQADASGRYSIAVPPVTVTGDLQYPTVSYGFVAVGSATDQNLSLGAVVDLPPGVQPQYIVFDTPGLSDGAEITNATPAAAPSDDASHSALLLNVDAFAGDFAAIDVYADGGTAPIASGTGEEGDGSIKLTTAPLTLGPHTLTLTETLRGGEVVSGNPSYAVTVTAPTSVDGTARAVGAIAGGTVTENSRPAAEEGDSVRSVTDGGGAYDATVRATPNPEVPLTLTDGYDAVTGLPIGGPLADFATADGKGGATLTAPTNYGAVSSLTSIVAGLGADNADLGSDDVPFEDAFETLDAFGLNDRLDLSTLGSEFDRDRRHRQRRDAGSRGGRRRRRRRSAGQRRRDVPARQREQGRRGDGIRHRR